MKLYRTYILLVLSFLYSSQTIFAQHKMKVRIAKIVIDSAYIDEYRAALAEHAAIAVKVEPGVLTLHAVYDKEHPAHVTVFEVYASDSAYAAHIKTPHFLKYKTGTMKMVKSLVLSDVIPIALEAKPIAEIN